MSKWIKIGRDDFKLVEGNYLLRVEKMNKGHWWWAVYKDGKELMMDCHHEDGSGRTEFSAKRRATSVMIRDQRGLNQRFA